MFASGGGLCLPDRAEAGVASAPRVGSSIETGIPGAIGEAVPAGAAQHGPTTCRASRLFGDSFPGL